MTDPQHKGGWTPEIGAAVEAMRGAIEWDKARGYRMPYRVRDPLYAAIARLPKASPDKSGGA